MKRPSKEDRIAKSIIFRGKSQEEKRIKMNYDIANSVIWDG